MRLVCCGDAMKLVGNYKSAFTDVECYECSKCDKSLKLETTSYGKVEIILGNKE